MNISNNHLHIASDHSVTENFFKFQPKKSI